MSIIFKPRSLIINLDNVRLLYNMSTDHTHPKFIRDILLRNEYNDPNTTPQRKEDILASSDRIEESRNELDGKPFGYRSPLFGTGGRSRRRRASKKRKSGKKRSIRRKRR